MPQNDNNSMVAGFLTGALVGAGLALVFAPNSGDETRRQLGATARKFSDGAKGSIRNMRSTFKESTDNVPSAVDASREVSG